MQPQCISTIRKQSNLNTVTARYDRIWWLIILFQPNIFKNMWVSTTIIDHPWWHHSKSFRLMLQPPCKCWPSHFFCIFTLFLELLSLLCDAYITCRAGLDISRTCEKGNTMECIYIYICMILQIIKKYISLYIYICEGCSKFFHLENAIFAKKNYFRRTFANSMFIFRGTCWPRFLRKTWMCDILKLFQASDPSSHFILRQLHLNIYVLL